MEQFFADGAALPAKGIIHPDPIAEDVNPSATHEVGQVARDGGLWQFEHRHQVADAEFAFGLQQQDDPEADRVGKGFDGLGEMFQFRTSPHLFQLMTRMPL